MNRDFLKYSFTVTDNFARHTYDSLMSEISDDVVEVLKKTGTYDITTSIEVDGVTDTALNHFIANLHVAVNVESKITALLPDIIDITPIVSKWSSSPWIGKIILLKKQQHVFRNDILQAYNPHPFAIEAVVTDVFDRPFPIDLYLANRSNVNISILELFHRLGFHMNTVYTPEPWIEQYHNMPMVLQFYSKTYPPTQSYLRMLWLHAPDEFNKLNVNTTSLYWLSDTDYLSALENNSGDMIYSDPVNYVSDAAYHGFYETTVELLDTFPELEIPLSIAVRGSKSIELVRELLRRGADPNKGKATLYAIQQFKDNKNTITYTVARLLLSHGGFAQHDALPDELQMASNTLALNIEQQLKRQGRTQPL
ncbi:hypothetical protein [Scale drop disease virus]|uniref:ORF_083L n=1 Tax=Scale drop disease virus TaxID=1697349 RepID=A0A0K1L6W1_9VIRU|nr:ORF_083L [Scale drop disease virus]AKU37498.1 ORF_083L [Scale drop disease virus]QLI60757.1 hypothetical protein [Scale drop disease virus]QXJ13675.1 ORF083L [Scale drop disease virus]